MLRTIAIIVALVAAALGGYMLSEGLYGSSSSSSSTTTATAAKSELPWVVAAPGRVEPGSGEFRLGASILGQVADVPVKVNDKIEDGVISSEERPKRDGKPPAVHDEEHHHEPQPVASAAVNSEPPPPQPTGSDKSLRGRFRIRRHA